MSDEIAWDKTVSDVNDGILAATGKPHPMYYGALGLSLTCLLIGIVAWALQITYGMGLSGLNSPVYWGTYITNFVFWVGIGHAGTLISAILFLFRAKWQIGRAHV